VFACVDDDAGLEAWTEFVAEQAQAARVGRGDDGCGLGFDSGEYVQATLARDLPDVVDVRVDPFKLEQLLRLLAARTSGLVNYAALGGNSRSTRRPSKHTPSS
jgi:hypothetical protein